MPAPGCGQPTAPSVGGRSLRRVVAAFVVGPLRWAADQQRSLSGLPGSSSSAGRSAGQPASQQQQAPKASQPQGAKQRAVLPGSGNGKGLLCARAATGDSIAWWEAAPPGSRSSVVRPLRQAATKQRQPLRTAGQRQQRGLLRRAVRQRAAEAADPQGLPTSGSEAKSRSAGVAAVVSGRSAGQRQSNADSPDRWAAPPGSDEATAASPDRRACSAGQPASQQQDPRTPKASQPQEAKQRAALPG